MHSFAAHLDLASKAARAAGDLLRADFHRPGGPRGKGDKAPADTEAEEIVRTILLAGGSDWGFLGEETGTVDGAPGRPVWVVDPNDGTRDFIRGRRGSSVSIALVFEGRPVLGVVHPFNWPDDRGAMYAAAEGREGVFKDGAPLRPHYPERLTAFDVVLVSGGGDRAARANLQCTRPARIMAIPSIAHRLARVAGGEAAATNSLYTPKSWDFAAGHCLLRMGGGALVDVNGREPSYDAKGNGSAPRLFASSLQVAHDLRTRPWDDAFHAEREAATPLVRLARGAACSNTGKLSRAQGAFVGQLAGSAFWASFASAEPEEFKSRDSAAFLEAAERRAIMPGQLGAGGELLIAASRSWIERGADSRTLLDAYAAWDASSPLQTDRGVRAASGGHASSEAQGASALVRALVFVLSNQNADAKDVARAIDVDVVTTHPRKITREAAQALGVLVHSLVEEGDATRAIDAAESFTRSAAFSREVIEAFLPGSSGSVPPFAETSAVSCLRASVDLLRSEVSFEDALWRIVALRPGSDGPPAIAGLVLGSRYGRDAIPEWLRSLVLSARPLEGFARQPRPAYYWGTDALTIAEALLAS